MRPTSENPVAARGRGRAGLKAPAMDYLPVFLRLCDRPVVVVGGGAVALRKVSWLLKAGARVTVIAPSLHAQLALLVAQGAVTHAASAFIPAQLAGAVAVVAATSDAALNATVSQAARTRAIPVNV